MKNKLLAALSIAIISISISSSFFTKQNLNNHVHASAISAEHVFNECSSLSFKQYSPNPYTVEGYVYNIPTLKSETQKITFLLTDSLDSPTTDNQLIVFSSLTSDKVHRGDRVEVTGYIRYVKSNQLVLTSYLDVTCSTRKISCTHSDEYNEVIDELRMYDICNYIADKDEHYFHTDDFVKDYQQSSGGYIDNAKKAGILIDKSKGEPNQKWHFFESWFYPSLIGEESAELQWEESAKSRVYSKLVCPELLLWIYEATDVSPTLVERAKLVAIEGKQNSISVSTIAKNMRGIVSWKDIETNLRSELRVTNVEKYLDLNIDSSYQLYPSLNWKEDSFNYSSLNEDVATVSPMGMITSVNQGNTKIKVSLARDESVFAEIDVYIFDHGSLMNPLSVSAAKDSLSDSLKNNEDQTTTPLYIEGVVESTNGDNNNFALKDHNTEDVINVSSFIRENQPFQNDNIVIKGFLKKESSSLTIFDDISLVSLTRGESTITIPNKEKVRILIDNLIINESFQRLNNSSISFTLDVDEGEEIRKVTVNNEEITPSENTYTFIVKGHSIIDIQLNEESINFSSTYIVKDDIGGGRTKLETKESVLDALYLSEDSENIIEDIQYIVSINGGYSSSMKNVIKMGTTSLYGSITFNTTKNINYIIIKGCTTDQNLPIKVGDSASSDWNDSLENDEKTVTKRLSYFPIISSKITPENFGSIRFDFTPTNCLRITNQTMKSLCIRSIEFGYENESTYQTRLLNKDGSFIDVDSNTVNACDNALKLLYDSGKNSICRTGYTISALDWNEIKTVFTSANVDLTKLVNIISDEYSDVFVYRFLARYEYIVSTFSLEAFIEGRSIPMSRRPGILPSIEDNNFILPLALMLSTIVISAKGFILIKKKKSN